MATICLNCGKENESELDLCPRCEQEHLQTQLMFDDFFKTDALHRASREARIVKHSSVTFLDPQSKKVPNWQEEKKRMLKFCNMPGGPQCLANYTYLVHRICIDKRMRFWNALILVVFFFRREWCIQKYFDRGQVKDAKKGIPGRTRGWKLYIFNPFNYMEIAMEGFAKWCNVTMKDQGWTRKMLVAKAEEVIKDDLTRKA